MKEKLTQITEILDEFEIDLWLTYVRETAMHADPILPFICDLDFTWETAILITRSQKIVIVGHFDAANVVALGLYDQVITYHEGIGEALRQTIADLQPQQIAVNYSTGDVAADGLTHGLYLNLQRYLADTVYPERLISAERIIAALRGRKTPTEAALVRQAVATTEQLFAEVGQFAQPGMTQAEIAAFVHRRIAELGLDYAWPQPFNPIVTCGPHSAVGHAAPGDVILEKEHLLHLDLGVKQAGYCSDLQRMWYVLADDETEAPPEVQRAFTVVQGAIETGKGALKPGVPGWQVDEVAREFVVDHGYDEYMHAFGHLLGRAAHDGATVLGPRWERYAGICELPVEVGNIFTLELHVIVPERGMMSLEEDVLVTDNGVEYLGKPQTELWIIG